MSEIEVGKAVPNFHAPATGGETIELAELRGKNVVLFFYPKANTPGCSQEGQDFRDANEAFAALNTVVLGISRDGVKAQENFKAKYDFPFPLIADKDEAVCRLFDVIKQKNMYGRQVMGIERSTFLIAADGKLHKEWRKVKVKGHVEDVLAATQELAS
ncbi:peroxiredoxin [Alkalilimnicola ehrlichii]|uniref:thioredoxin-dependent peroxiredoxin n=1 Tax=Alkalilimnicola ehrlichii TaxID=351052 RepID=A0A3E0WIY0_9GAMM|nr:peroxiredoxin [Alkalilimnicola ehrlichii]RFA24810.1 peroxiredoxin [Alkalilimnicola ehrlichii]RFA32067.1 peroxiredoxin [Alkalilimnicola ehrlichii]